MKFGPNRAIPFTSRIASSQKIRLWITAHSSPNKPGCRALRTFARDKLTGKAVIDRRKKRKIFEYEKMYYN
jgi:hypothetical protein